MSDVIRLARHARHYLAIFDKGKALGLYRTKRLASLGQRIVLYANKCSGYALVVNALVSSRFAPQSRIIPSIRQVSSKLWPPILFSSTHRAATAAVTKEDTNMTSTSEARL
jgi:hypothetical protein